MVYEKELSIIVPCYNEQDNIPALVERLAKVLRIYNIEGEIFLIDDGSKDKTWKVIQEMEIKHPFVRGFHHKKNKGIVGGWRTGSENAQGEYVVTIDADLQYVPEDILRLYDEMQRGKADLVQGWRHYSEDRNFIRWFQGKVFSTLLDILFFMMYKDIKSGFIMYKNDVFKDVLKYKYSYKHFQHLITIAAHCKGYKIVQVPVIFNKRSAGVSYLKDIPVKFIWQTLQDLPKALIEYRIMRGK